MSSAHSEFMGWSLFQHQDITAVLSDPITYSNQSHFLAIPNGIDPPLHKQYREALAPNFSKESLSKLESFARRLAIELLHDINSNEKIEFVNAFIAPFSIKALCLFFGLA